jgi:hypothetical protein
MNGCMVIKDILEKPVVIGSLLKGDEGGQSFSW